jgi:tRNA-dihydrouridine synthase
MASIDRAGELAGRVRQATGRRLSVKLRIGLEDDFEYLVAFCRRLESEGVERITLHPRTAKEKFRRRARWDYVARLRSELKIPVAGNGDINGAAELAARASSGICDAVMSGRAAIRQPWIFAAAKAEAEGLRFDAVSIEETGLRFLELLKKHQPPEFHLSRAKLFFGYFCGNVVWGNYLKNLLNRESTLSGLAEVWRNYFRENGG